MLRELLCGVVRLTGAPFLVRQLLQRDRVTILLYHRLDPATADAHFAALRKLYTPISLQAYLEARRDNTFSALPTRALIVTIDDGHKSVYSLKSVLLKHGVPVTVFLCSGLVGTGRQFWFSIPALSDEQRQYLKTVPDEARIAALRSLGFDEEAESGERDSLNIDEVRELQGFVDFQSHSVSHPILSACPEDKARDEIALSRTQLEAQIARDINALAYPNGSYTSREVRLTRHAGYTCGLTTNAGFNDDATPLFELNRITIRDGCGIHELIVRTCGLWALLRSAMRIGSSPPLQVDQLHLTPAAGDQRGAGTQP